MRSRITRYSLAFALAVLPLPAGLSSAMARPTVEVAFVLDTTGSMSRLIEGAKRKIWSIATAIVDSNPDANIRMGLVAYRDIGDEYVTTKIELTRDIQDLYANLLEFKARGGGDWPESVNEALDVAINKLQWTPGAESRRIVFLVGDAPPHMDYAQDTKYPLTLAVARQKDIIVNTVLAGDARDTERVWRDIAQIGNGRFIAIPQDGGQVVVIETPYDQDIIILQRQINETVIPYGSPELQKRTEIQVEKAGRMANAAPASASDMASFINKRSKVTSQAITSGGDLVADAAAGGTSVSSVKEEDLPVRLRAMKPEERSAEVAKQIDRRKALNEQLATLVAKRDKYVGDQLAKAPRTSSFDGVVEDTLKAQIKR
ncbi:VWA domain-containing protein [Bradyrhizobium sp. CCGUVB23]|uniref:vWA domain-containing protein n=1 Tax=Bradyrhizobium sp. CCGUVB23 TaxID=2949630 RepID=UPI0020B1EF4C|nr:vWA domain-containing protein [Bradyrhizobium sp. CCGUVB23]MCP3462377.1 VWA domain-containing protein [Bradyrhizobium sp. CCGUVB23]